MAGSLKGETPFLEGRLKILKKYICHLRRLRLRSFHTHLRIEPGIIYLLKIIACYLTLKELL